MPKPQRRVSPNRPNPNPPPNRPPNPRSSIPPKPNPTEPIKWAPGVQKRASFSEILFQKARKAAPSLIKDSRHPEPLSNLDYSLELELKREAFDEFWKMHGLKGKPEPIIPSPRPRFYRTTSKRRVVKIRGGFALSFMTEASAIANPEAAKEALVEPKEHGILYKFILGKLNSPSYLPLAQALNFLIIRGDYTRFTVLFNVHVLNAEVVRKTKLLSEHFQKMDPKVVSAFVYFDPSRSDFYFEAKLFEGPWQLKKLFGPDEIQVKVLNRTYTFHPTAFCQVNASILPDFLHKADELLSPKVEHRLIDLYSGFGFFTLHLGSAYHEALGIDLGSVAIESAQKMAAAQPSTHCRFRSGRIQVPTLNQLLPAINPNKSEVLLLDPPRQGTEPGVIQSLSARHPTRVLHIFCDLDTLPKEVQEWNQNGYTIARVIALDMFPGTDNLEVMVLLLPRS